MDNSLELRDYLKPSSSESRVYSIALSLVPKRKHDFQGVKKEQSITDMLTKQLPNQLTV